MKKLYDAIYYELIYLQYLFPISGTNSNDVTREYYDSLTYTEETFISNTEKYIQDIFNYSIPSHEDLQFITKIDDIITDIRSRLYFYINCMEVLHTVDNYNNIILT